MLGPQSVFLKIHLNLLNTGLIGRAEVSKIKEVVYE